jgi:IS5 family transposase
MRCLQERIAHIILDGTVDNIQTRKHARKRILSLVIFKRKIKEGNVEWFKLMTNLIHECVGVVAHLLLIWKTDFHCNQGLLPISIQRFSLFTSAKSRRRTMW